MAFGGYKFAGYLVDNSQYQTSIERCAAIHAARIRAFMDASAKAGNPWIIDPAWKDGEFDIDFSTYTVKGVYKADDTEVTGRFVLVKSTDNSLCIAKINDGYSWSAARVEYTAE